MNNFEMTLSPEGVRALHYAVNEAVRLWPGSPARPVEEQVALKELKMAIFAMVMEMTILED